MFFPFNNYKVIDVPQTNSESGSTVYTTTAKCIMIFEPDGTGMETDRPAWIFIKDFYSDTDGQEISPIIWGAYDAQLFDSGAYNAFSASIANNVDLGDASDVRGMVSNIIVCPSGKQIRARVSDNSDRIKGKLHVFELPA